jgi:hypothetical protein
MAYPDLTDELARFTFPAELKGHQLQVINAQSRVTLCMPVTALGLVR